MEKEKRLKLKEMVKQNLAQTWRYKQHIKDQERRTDIQLAQRFKQVLKRLLKHIISMIILSNFVKPHKFT